MQNKNWKQEPLSFILIHGVGRKNVSWEEKDNVKKIEMYTNLSYTELESILLFTISIVMFGD